MPLNLCVYAVLAALAFGYIGGCTHEKGRFDDYKIAVEAVGKAAEDRRNTRIAAAKDIKRRVDRAHELETTEWQRRYADLSKRMLDDPGSSLGGAAAGIAGSGEEVCYPRPGFLAAMAGLEKGILGLLSQGQNAVQVAKSCRDWAEELGRR